MYRHLTSYLPETQLASLTASLLTQNVHHPTIDKITLLADLRHYERNLDDLSRHNDFLDTVPDYSMHYRYRLRTASDLFIQIASPLGEAKVPNLRIEFNPNKFDYRGSLWHTLLPMLRNKRLTRIDYAIDYTEDLSHWRFTTDRPRKSNRFNAPNGQLETLYLGSRVSSDQYRIYDKAKEMKERATDSLATAPLWRIEQQFKLDTRTEFWMIKPFADLTVWKPDTYTGDYIDDLVLADLYANDQHWSRLSRRKYTTYRRMIQDSHRVIHMPIKPVTTFQQGYPKLEAFLKELLA